jgi:3-hydroxy-9,10-secoandrosta-1,3,5(10)-triene-9,17-dione monooxygenase reductase component
MRDVPTAERRFDPAEFRRALGQYPTGVTIVTAMAEDRPIGVTANSFSSVSLDPPLVSWCVAISSSGHDAFVAADAFAVHLLGADQHELALSFAGRGRDRFAGVEHGPGRLGAPILRGVEPVFECRTWARYPGGDHTIIVGEVTDMVTRVQDPLLFHSGVMRGIERSRRPSSPPLGSFAENYLAYLLARASYVVSGGFHPTLRTHGLSVDEWRILACLSGADAVRIAELAAMSLASTGRVTAVLDALEAAGLVLRAPDEGHGLVRLTEAGWERIRPVIAAAESHEAEVTGRLTVGGREQLKHALHLLIDGPPDVDETGAAADRKRVSAGLEPT